MADYLLLQTELDAHTVDLEIIQIGRAVALARADSHLCIERSHLGDIEFEGHLPAAAPVALSRRDPPTYFPHVRARICAQLLD